MSQSSVAPSFTPFVCSPSTQTKSHPSQSQAPTSSNTSSRSSVSGTPSPPGSYSTNGLPVSKPQPLPPSSTSSSMKPSKSPLRIKIESPPLGAKLSANLLTMPSASTPTSVSSGATPASSMAPSSVASSSSPSKTSTSPQPGATNGSAASATPCCETGRIVFTDPITGQSVCSCQYDAQLLNYQRLAASAGLPLTMYGPAAMAAAAAAAAYANGPSSGTPTPGAGLLSGLPGQMPPTSQAQSATNNNNNSSSSLSLPPNAGITAPLPGAPAPLLPQSLQSQGPNMTTSGGPPGDTGSLLPLLPEQLQSAAVAPPFFPPGANGFDLKDSVDMWRNLNPAAYTVAAAASMYYPYDSSAVAAAGLAAYPFASGYGMDLNGARRKNATRETTSTLKAWLNDHRKNPYPTKGEKIILAVMTKMTLTQVSTWFANARRRLKKENKMTWSPRNRCDDDDDDDDKDDTRDDDSDIVDIEDDSASESKMPLSLNNSMVGKFRMDGHSPLSDIGSFSDSDRLFSAGKPRIWSIVDTATSHAAAAAAQQAHAHLQQQHQQNQSQQQQSMKQDMEFGMNQSSANSGNSSSSSLSPPDVRIKSECSSIGPISPSNQHRQAMRDYASPYQKPNPVGGPGNLPPHSVASGAMPPHLAAAGWPYSAAAAAAAAAAFSATGAPGFPSLYGCPQALMSQLMGAGVGPGGPPAFPPHLMESSLNRLRNAAVAAAAAASNGNSAK